MEDHLSSTIAAISTGAGSAAGIGIVRISGEDAIKIADRIYRGGQGKSLSEQKTYTIHYGQIVDGDEVIDEVLVMLMKGPGSYTGEDTVEINCHGGIYVTRRVLDTAVKYGARLAEPGEFTKRAFLNGKMDLTQAEAVGDLISAENEYARQSSVSHLNGILKKEIEDIRNKIIYETAYIESALDDPEHISLEGYPDRLLPVVEELEERIRKLLSTCEDGRLIKEGIRTVILGRPNVGKSSLLNALTGEDRAIVTQIPGTTRDLLEEQVSLSGITLRVIDTAGIHPTEDTIEKIGVEKARTEAANADLLLYVIDASTPLTENDEDIFRMPGETPAVILLNKSDLETVVTEDEVREAYFASNPAKSNGENVEEPPIISVSAVNGDGLDKFEETVKSMFFAGNLSFNDEIYITNTRHKEALTDALAALTKVEESIHSGLPEDFYSIDLMDAYEALGKITGETIGEDLTDEIFSKFCMGK